MTGQPSLFDPPRAAKRRLRRATADTSTDGLLDVQDRASTQRQVILHALRAHGPMTRHELAAVCAFPLSSVCGRASELLASGLVRERVEAGRRIRKDGRHVLEATFQTINQRAG